MPGAELLARRSQPVGLVIDDEVALLAPLASQPEDQVEATRQVTAKPGGQRRPRQRRRVTGERLPRPPGAWRTTPPCRPWSLRPPVRRRPPGAARTRARPTGRGERCRPGGRRRQDPQGRQEGRFQAFRPARSASSAAARVGTRPGPDHPGQLGPEVGGRKSAASSTPCTKVPMSAPAGDRRQRAGHGPQAQLGRGQPRPAGVSPGCASASAGTCSPGSSTVPGSSGSLLTSRPERGRGFMGRRRDARSTNCAARGGRGGGSNGAELSSAGRPARPGPAQHRAVAPSGQLHADQPGDGGRDLLEAVPRPRGPGRVPAGPRPATSPLASLASSRRPRAECWQPLQRPTTRPLWCLARVRAT